jgi:hypothetical protein
MEIQPPKKRGRGRPTALPKPIPAPLPVFPEDPWPTEDHQQMSVDFDPTEIPDPSVDTRALSLLEADEFRAVLSEMHSRTIESLRLFEPMPGDQADFLASDAGERLVFGGNRGGKTLVTCVELARALTGQDPHGKYPLTNGRAIGVGKDLKHCAKVIFRKLFKPGAFQLIRDLETGELRAYRPNDPIDMDRDEEDVVPAPPLIPSRFYDYRKISWENKKEELPSTVYLHNGWEVNFFSSLGAPPQGWDIDIALFDEEIVNPLWYKEMSARLLDRRKKNRTTGKVKSGKFIWSATPQGGTVELFNLYVRAEKLAGNPDAPIKSFSLNLLKNSYMSKDAKDDFIGKITDEQEYGVRVEGRFALMGSRVYPEFQPRGVHAFRDEDDNLVSFPIPYDWTRYWFIDPGRQRCAVLCVAIPPPTSPHRGRKFIYDELYIKNCDASIFADRVKAKMGTQVIEAWWIDHQCGQVTEIASGKTIEEQYSAALKAIRVGCVATEHRFHHGSNNPDAGILAVRSGLTLDKNDKSTWIILNPSVPYFIEEAERYSFQKDPNGNPTDKAIKKNDHLMDCWRYAAMAKLPWVPPQDGSLSSRNSPAGIMAAKKKKAKSKSGWGGAIKLG